MTQITLEQALEANASLRRYSQKLEQQVAAYQELELNAGVPGIFRGEARRRRRWKLKRRNRPSWL